MPSLFVFAEQVLTEPDTQAKLKLTHKAWQRRQQGQWSLEATATPPLPPEAAAFPAHPVLVDPKDLPRRKLSSREGQIALLHAVAHIEFSAVQLAWDHLYRFRDMPEQYYWDWLAVAWEEAQHFELLQGRLHDLGTDYGDLPAHAGLWGIASETAYDVLARMALVPRFMEARGLDVTPGMIGRLQAAGDVASVAVLERILRDEIGHVALGTHWFRWVCAKRDVEPEREYFALIDRHLRGQARGPFNHALRLQAGFSESELIRLDNPHGFG